MLCIPSCSRHLGAGVGHVGLLLAVVGEQGVARSCELTREAAWIAAATNAGGIVPVALTDVSMRGVGGGERAELLERGVRARGLQSTTGERLAVALSRASTWHLPVLFCVRASY